MNRDETIMIMAVLKAAYPMFYKDMSRRGADAAINLWCGMFADCDMGLVEAAVKEFIASDVKGYPPHVGAIKESIHRIQNPTELSESEAWSIVSKALGNGYYGAKEEYAKLPPVIQRCVGSHNTLREWATMDIQTLNSVVSSNFMRSYRSISEKQRAYQKAPADVKRIMSGIAERLRING